jgi:TRAP-type C4-dicarboxylate transport system permease small subunit
VAALASLLARLNAPLARAGVGLAALLLALMLAMAVAQIVSRTLFGHSLDWTEELARVALVWSVLAVAPHAYRSGAHVAIMTFAEALPPRLLAAISVLLNLLVVWICAVLLRESFAFVARGFSLDAATLPIRMAWIYAIVPVAFGSMILVGLELLLRLVMLLRGRESGIVMEGVMPAVRGAERAE